MITSKGKYELGDYANFKLDGGYIPCRVVDIDDNGNTVTVVSLHFDPGAFEWTLERHGYVGHSQIMRMRSIPHAALGEVRTFHYDESGTPAGVFRCEDGARLQWGFMYAPAEIRRARGLV